ncbi:hypothetical protein BN59_02814 [Legionella massiliensis]|uniref:Leucine Rich repeats (2 copies) n=1 Tax=Legionella massiliensis TaxID=1034943 RepID=A0A078L323_9GAMM|nr:hypothetical protein [Legionella massiliensis]CDZ78504.1 hypothetical protein BN59_02814 [Legionella massiliensis]CEE14242.1 hypothetical protein BN1094_02814 [Legionella massiliensis]
MGTFRIDEATLMEDGDAFVSAFCLIPPTESIMDLKKSKLYSKSSYTLGRAFGSMPSSITEIDLSLNSLHLKTVEELQEMFSGLTESVRKINISLNGFKRFSEEELIAIISSMKFVEEVIFVESTLTNDQRQELATILHQATNKTIITSLQKPSFFSLETLASSFENHHEEMSFS